MNYVSSVNKPDFMVIGASKCGTSTLRNYLAQHPDILMITKEIQFFSCDDIYANGLSWYESLFESDGPKKLKGEVSNLYTMREVYPNAVARIAEYAPDIKLIYCAREPMSRIQSYWLEMRAHGGEDVHYDFNVAVKANKDWLVDSTNYWQQINAYRAVFSDERIHVIFFEDLVKDPTTVMRGCFSFLGVNPESLGGFDLHLGSTQGRLMPRNSLSKLRQYSLYRAVTKLIPPAWRNSLRKKFLFKKIQGKPDWQPETRAWVASILESDTLQFLEQYGKPQNFWQLRS